MKKNLHHIVIGGRSTAEASLIAKLSTEERKALIEWSNEAQREHGTTNLMRWPGWSDVMRRSQSDLQSAWEQTLDVIDQVKSRTTE